MGREEAKLLGCGTLFPDVQEFTDDSPHSLRAVGKEVICWGERGQEQGVNVREEVARADKGFAELP